MRHSTRLAVILGITFAAYGGATNAQTVNSENFRSYASCEEVTLNGRVFHTFGEGPCPAGTRRPLRYSSRNLGRENALQLNSAAAQVAALQDAQQALLGVSMAIANAAMRDSAERLTSYDFHFADFGSVAEMYIDMAVTFPLPGSVIVARPGDVVLSERTAFYSDCFMPLEDRTVRQWPGHVHNIVAREAACKLGHDHRAYAPLYENYSTSDVSFSMPLTLDERGTGYRVCYRYMGMNAMCANDYAAGQIARTIGLVERLGNATDVLIFEGLDETGEIRLRMRETGQPVEHDLSASSVIRVGDVGLEVLEATADVLVVRRLPD